MRYAECPDRHVGTSLFRVLKRVFGETFSEMGFGGALILCLPESPSFNKTGGRKGNEVMNEMIRPMLGAVLCVAIAGGCYSPKVVYNSYPTTVFAEVALKNDAKMKIVSAPDSESLCQVLRTEFSKTKRFSIVDGEADYWMIVNALSDVRTDTAGQIPFNDKTEVVAVGAKSDEVGAAHETLAVQRRASRTLAKGVSIAIYEVGRLAPIHYFEIPVYDGAFKVAGGADVATKEEMEKELTEQIVGRVKDVFVTQVKNVETPVPEEASAELKRAMLSDDAAKAVVDAARTILPQTFNDFLTDVQAGKYADQKDVLVQKLSDYYVLAIAREIGCLDAKTLKELHAQQVAILQLSTTDSLALACPVALARLEYKLANLGIKL